MQGGVHATARCQHREQSQHRPPADHFREPSLGASHLRESSCLIGSFSTRTSAVSTRAACVLWALSRNSARVVEKGSDVVASGYAHPHSTNIRSMLSVKCVFSGTIASASVKCR
jgi:hypothetical protein